MNEYKQSLWQMNDKNKEFDPQEFNNLKTSGIITVLNQSSHLVEEQIYNTRITVILKDGFEDISLQSSQTCKGKSASVSRCKEDIVRQILERESTETKSNANPRCARTWVHRNKLSQLTQSGLISVSSKSQMIDHSIIRYKSIVSIPEANTKKEFTTESASIKICKKQMYPKIISFVEESGIELPYSQPIVFMTNRCISKMIRDNRSSLSLIPNFKKLEVVSDLMKFNFCRNENYHDGIVDVFLSVYIDNKILYESYSCVLEMQDVYDEDKMNTLFLNARGAHKVPVFLNSVFSKELGITNVNDVWICDLTGDGCVEANPGPLALILAIVMFLYPTVSEDVICHNFSGWSDGFRLHNFTNFISKFDSEDCEQFVVCDSANNDERREMKKLGNQRWISSNYCNCSNVKCNGNVEFCKKKKCYRNNYDCYCEQMCIKPVMMSSEFGMNKVELHKVNYTTCRKSSPIERLSHKTSREKIEYVMGFNRYINSRKRQQTGDFSLEIPELRFFSQSYADVRLELHKGTHTQIIDCDENYCKMIIENRFFREEGNIIAQAHRGISIINERVFHIGKSDVMCEKPNCNYCTEYLSRMSCYSDPERQEAVAFITLNSIIACTLLISMMIFIYKCRKEAIDGQYNLNLVTTALILLLIVSPTKGCDDVFTIKSDVLTCVDDVDDSECFLSSKVQVTFSYIGQKTCYDVADSNGNNVGKISVELKQVQYYANLRRLYYTSDWTAKGCSQRYCRYLGPFGDSKCSDDQDCTTPYSSSDTSMGGAISSECADRVSDYGCSSSGACISNDCVSCEDSCHYYSVAFTSQGPAYSVSEYEDSLRIDTTEICIIDSLGENCSSFTPDFPFDDYGISLSYVGNFGSVPNVRSYKVIFGEDGMGYLGKASNANDLVKGMTGDIQGTSPNALRTVAPFAFKKADNLCDINLDDINEFIRCHEPGLNYREFRESPVRIDGVTWVIDEGIMTGDDSSPSPVQIGIEFKNISITQRYENVCPDGSFTSIAGCYNCDDGFVLKIKARTNCLEGSAIIYTKDFSCSPNSILLEKTTKDYELICQSRNEIIVSTLTLTSGRNRKTINIQGRLEEPKVILNSDNETVIIAKSDKSKFDLGDFGSWDIGHKIGLGIGVALGLLVCCILSFLLAYFIPSFLSMMRMYRPLSKESQDRDSGDRQKDNMMESDNESGEYDSESFETSSSARF